MPNFVTYEDAQVLFAEVEEEFEKRIMKFSVMPPFTEYEIGTVVQYVGVTNEHYTNGYFYKRTDSGWEQKNVQPGSSGSGVQSDWTENNQNDPAYIKHKPGNATKNNDGFMSKEDKNKLDDMDSVAPLNEDEESTLIGFLNNT